MLTVMRKDLILNRNVLLVNGLLSAEVLAVLSSVPGASAPLYVVLSGFLVTIAPLAVVSREDKSRAMTLGCSGAVRSLQDRAGVAGLCLLLVLLLTIALAISHAVSVGAFERREL